MVGSSIDRCPRCAATGSAGTLCETTNAINVMPNIRGSISRSLLTISACTALTSSGLGGALRASALSGLGGALRAPLGPVVAPLVPRFALLPAPTPRLMGLFGGRYPHTFRSPGAHRLAQLSRLTPSLSAPPARHGQ